MLFFDTPVTKENITLAVETSIPRREVLSNSLIVGKIQFRTLRLKETNECRRNV